MNYQLDPVSTRNLNHTHNAEHSVREASPYPCGATESGFRRFSAACLQKLHDIKERVASELASEFGRVLGRDAVRQAVAEADSLAALTPFPALFLPTLAEEKVRAASDWHARQSLILERSRILAAVAEERTRAAGERRARGAGNRGRSVVFAA